MRRFWMLMVLAGCSRAPELSAPVVLAYEAGAARIEGRGFGSPGPRAEVVASGTTIGSGVAGVSWTDERIDLTLPPGVRSGELVVRTQSGEVHANLEVYRLEE